MVGEAFLLHILESTLFHMLKHGVVRPKILPCYLYRRTENIRVSFSMLLQVRDGSEYLLVRNLHRKETFGPFGGVVKTKGGASEALDALEFEFQEIDRDMRGDLRGFLPRRHLGALLTWYARRANRETPDECLTRELGEEIVEAEVAGPKLPDILLFKPVRRIEEGPYLVPGEDYTQYIIF